MASSHMGPWPSKLACRHTPLIAAAASNSRPTALVTRRIQVFLPGLVEQGVHFSRSATGYRVDESGRQLILTHFPADGHRAAPGFPAGLLATGEAKRPPGRNALPGSRRPVQRLSAPQCTVAAQADTIPGENQVIAAARCAGFAHQRGCVGGMVLYSRSPRDPAGAPSAW